MGPHFVWRVALSRAKKDPGQRKGSGPPADCGNQGEQYKIIMTRPTFHHYVSRAPDPP